MRTLPCFVTTIHRPSLRGHPVAVGPTATQRSEQCDLALRNERVLIGERGARFGQRPLGVDRLKRVHDTLAVLCPGDRSRALGGGLGRSEGAALLERARIARQGSLGFLERGQDRAVECRKRSRGVGIGGVDPRARGLGIREGSIN